jgi:RNA polymerase sigma-70 factor (sigma-E family)
MGRAEGGGVESAEEREFRSFVSANSAGLLRFAYLLTGDVGLAEDAVQAVLARVFLKWRRVVHPAAYCRKALVSEVSSWRRRRHVEQVLVPEVPETGFWPESDALDGRLIAALRTLSARQRAVVVLRFFDDMAEQDVARLLGITEGTVKQHTHRAMLALRAAFGVPVKERET